MPEFTTPFADLANDRKISKQELIRAIRYSIAAEYEAIQLYMQLAESTDEGLAVEVLKDIADEERVHVGEFLRLLKEIAPEEMDFYMEGAQEVEEMMGKGGIKNQEAGQSGDAENPQYGLPFCRTAADPEHGRSTNEDEPCDDFRAGTVEEK
jgi:rubrerythrin